MIIVVRADRFRSQQRTNDTIQMLVCVCCVLCVVYAKINIQQHCHKTK